MTKNKHEIYGAIDEECLKLCDAINKVSGLETTKSCCGHGKHEFQIFIKPNVPEDLGLLFEVIKKVRSWQEMEIWNIKLLCRGQGCPVCYLLHSKSTGKTAYDESEILAYLIEKNLEPIEHDKEFDKKWNLAPLF